MDLYKLFSSEDTQQHIYIVNDDDGILFKQNWVLFVNNKMGSDSIVIIPNKRCRPSRYWNATHVCCICGGISLQKISCHSNNTSVCNMIVSRLNSLL